jgi:Tfp pilus assembly protein PilX
MLPDFRTRGNHERGIALVVAMLVLLVVSILAILVTATATVSTKISGLTSRRERALSLAEAGVAEASSRLRIGDVPATLNPHAVTQIFNVAPGSVPVLGADSTALATSQPAGSWLSYTTEDRGPNTLSIRYKTDASRSVIYKYDSSRSPALNTTTGEPVYEITSTGTVGTTRRTIVVDVVARPPAFNAKGALTAGGQIQTANNDYICGYNHSLSTPDWTSVSVGRNGPNPGADAQHSSCIPSEVGSGNMTGVWAGGSGQPTPVGNAGPIWGSPNVQYNQPGGYTGPWDMLGMSQADYAAWLPTRRSTAPSNWNGAFYLDKDATLNNGAGGWSFTNITGQGFLYIDGSVQISGTLFWKGMIYVNGQFQHQGTIWVLGALTGSAQMQTQNETGAILYSKDAIDYYIAQYAGKYTPISWREVN